MKIIHLWKGNKREKKIENNTGFLLTNKLGGYFSLTEKPASRYQGWFFVPPKLAGKKLFKIIENLEPVEIPESIKELKNNFWNIERKKGKIVESFFLPSFFNSLVYELNQSPNVELFLDFKESYDNQEFGRFYEISEKDKLILIKCRNNENIAYLAIKPNILDYQKAGEWVERFYQSDKDRNSPPFKRYVFLALRLKARKIVFSVAETKEKAKKEAKIVFENTEKLKRKEKERIEKLFGEKTVFNQKISPEIKMAYFCAKNSLNSLVVENKEIFAGFYWFFQFWQRDEIISLKALANFQKIFKNIFWQKIKSIKKDGNLGEGADVVGWLFKRAADFIEEKRFNFKEKKKIGYYLEKTIEKLLKYQTKEGLAINHPQKTWMDSLDRAGERIEIQCLRLNIYNLAYRLTKKKKYLQLEKELKEKVKQKFWSGSILIDGKSDFTIRPNIFLAAYIYPRLLTKKEWLKCFDGALSKLWLNWGGISTIDKKSPLFFLEHSGELSQSYHQGDSWFWVNNLTALVLYKFDKKRFQKYIDKILKAGTKEILWQGLISHQAELSSAKDLKSKGCLAQSWSSAFYLELISKIFKIQ